MGSFFRGGRPAILILRLASLLWRVRRATSIDAEKAVERELILRLASLLWRVRRAASIGANPIKRAIVDQDTIHRQLFDQCACR